MFTAVLSSVTNAALTALLTFFISEYALSLFIPTPAAKGLSVFFAATAFIAVCLFTSRSGKRRLFALRGEKEFLERMRNLYLCTDDEIGDIFRRLFDELHICARIDGRRMRFEGKTLFAALYPETLSANDLSVILRAYGNNTVVISSSFSDGAVSFAKEKGARLIDGASFGRFIDNIGLLPPASANARKKSFSEIVRPLFHKRSGKKLLFYAAVLAVFSSMTFYPVYYVVCATVFAVYGLIALFFGERDNVCRTDEALEDLFKKS